MLQHPALKLHLLPKSIWGHAGLFFKHPAEVLGRGKAALQSDGFQCQKGGAHQILGLCQTNGCDILGWRDVILGAKKPAQINLAHLGPFRKRFYTESGILVMPVNIGFDFQNSAFGRGGYIFLVGRGPDQTVNLIKKRHAVVKSGLGGCCVYMQQFFKKCFGILRVFRGADDTLLRDSVVEFKVAEQDLKGLGRESDRIDRVVGHIENITLADTKFCAVIKMIVGTACEDICDGIAMSAFYVGIPPGISVGTSGYADQLFNIEMVGSNVCKHVITSVSHKVSFIYACPYPIIFLSENQRSDERIVSKSAKYH